MRILHINYYDIQGGAAKAAYRLHRGLLETGQDSGMFVAEKKSNDNSVQQLFSKSRLQSLHITQRLEVMLAYWARKHHNFHHSLNCFNSGIVSQINSFEPDIVNLHWINGCMVSNKEIAQINAPIIWTLHDNWAYSGAEHYHFSGDERYRNGYGKSSFWDVNRLVWSQKIKYWKNLDFSVVAPSSWIGKEAAASRIMSGKNIQVIHNGIDLNTFSPQTKENNRQRKTIAFGAFDLSDWNKGGRELLQALRILRDKHKREFELLLIGNGKFGAEFQNRSTGFIVADKDLAKAYQQADVFVLASKYDNLPNMLVEASACGTPLAAFNTGGIPDIVEHRENGYLAEAFNSEDLADGINYILDDKNHSRLASTARKSAEKKFDINNIVSKYINLYKSITSE
ncbi:MAG: glycosyltransferase [Victivallaceae bacterium]|nr:glycosyltransferase [Victivallaceae bacterium]